jgi:hypothetical protein
MALVDNTVSRRELERLRALRIDGAALNVALLGVEYYLNAGKLLAELADLGMFIDLQVQADQLADLLPLLETTAARVIVDHCGRRSHWPGSISRASRRSCGWLPQARSSSRYRGTPNSPLSLSVSRRVVLCGPSKLTGTVSLPDVFE